jgi:4-diphosphocytidyl-2-C-methyl-D-erythritol kinase
MTALSDTAWAKINLTLELHGRRADGFHEIESLVAFARVGDSVELDPGGPLELTVEGPLAGALGGINLILEAAEAATALVPGLQSGSFRLVKRLPVAAGLGGGSADAAAALRLMARANPDALPESVLGALAAELGSDVTVCLASRPALIAGRGEKVETVRGFPLCGVLLANPGVRLATEAVYGALRAEALPASARGEEAPDFAGDFETLVAYLAPRGNALEAPAARLAPVVEDVRAALGALDGARIVRLSGSGPTCFALFATEDESKRAAATLAQAHPDWWLAATTFDTGSAGL